MGATIRSIWTRRLAVAALPLLLAAVPLADAVAADSAAGGALARQWCAGCHVVTPGATGPRQDMAPSFETIARTGKRTDDELRAWLRTSHPNMPNFDLSRVSVEDLVAYIRSLATQTR